MFLLKWLVSDNTQNAPPFNTEQTAGQYRSAKMRIFFLHKNRKETTHFTIVHTVN